MVIHRNHEGKGCEEVKEKRVLVSPPVHLGVVSSVAVAVVEITKATWGGETAM